MVQKKKLIMPHNISRTFHYVFTFHVFVYSITNNVLFSIFRFVASSLRIVNMDADFVFIAFPHFGESNGKLEQLLTVTSIWLFAYRYEFKRGPSSLFLSLLWLARVIIISLFYCMSQCRTNVTYRVSSTCRRLVLIAWYSALFRRGPRTYRPMPMYNWPPRNARTL